MGISIINRLTTNLKKAGLNNNLVVAGYKNEKLKNIGFDTILNSNFNKTNMVWSLFCAFDKILSWDSEFINIFYGDIVVSEKNIKNFLNCKSNFSVMVDLNWQKLWSLRMEDYFNDIESFKYQNDCILEIGKKVNDMQDVQGQYVGAIRIRRSILINLLENYKLKLSKLEDKNLVKKFQNLYMTEFIQSYIDSGGAVKPFFIKGGWLEVDSKMDLQAYESPDGKVFLDSVSNFLLR